MLGEHLEFVGRVFVMLLPVLSLLFVVKFEKKIGEMTAKITKI